MNHEKKIELIQEKIEAFSNLMLQRMERHIDKPDWTNQKPAYFLVKAMENLGEISRALTENGSKMQIIYAAADVANFLMMLSDVSFGLTSDSKPSTLQNTLPFFDEDEDGDPE